jgi:hypothetical protein
VKLKNHDDDDLCAEFARRLAEDEWMYWRAHEHLSDVGFTVNRLYPDHPSRVWVLRAGEWCNPNWRPGQEGETPAAPLVFLGGDEYGNRTLCLRLRRQRLLVIALNIPRHRTPWELEQVNYHEGAA